MRLASRSALVLIALSPATAPAQDSTIVAPDSVADEFHRALRSNAWGPAAQRLHPETLRRFHERLIHLAEVDKTGQTLDTLFRGSTLAEFRSLPSQDVFVRAMRVLAVDMPGLLNALVARRVEILGSVEEPPDRAYVVYRSESLIEGAVAEIRVMTLGRSGPNWRVLETEELEVIWEAMRRVGDRGR